MRHKYQTRALVLARTPLGEANALLTLLTEEVGLVRVRAQGLRKRGAKLAAALPTFAESEVSLVRGAEGWRVSGAALTHNWCQALSHPRRVRAARVTGLLLRLTPGESVDARLFHAFRSFLMTLEEATEDTHDAAECLVVLRLLFVLGLDTEERLGNLFGDVALAAVRADRSAYIARINRGIAASGL